jgi:universal stress protein E
VKRFKNILFVDGNPKSNRALRRAVDLARRNDSSLKVIEVIEDIPRGARGRGKNDYPFDLKDLLVKDSNERISALLEKIPKAERVPVENKLVFGTPFIEIIREVLRSNHDLVMMGVDGEGGLRERVFGSMTMHLMRKCPCPLWVIRPGRRKKFARILAAVAPTERKSDKSDLNETIMTLANSLAQMEKSPLHVVHCWTEPYEKLIKRQIGTKAADDMVQDTRNAHKAWMDQLLERHPPYALERHVHLLKGNPGSLIPQFARKRGVELVIIGTVSRMGIKGFFIGNTAERVLGEIGCSVMTVKPKGFVTPVSLDE